MFLEFSFVLIIQVSIIFFHARGMRIIRWLYHIAWFYPRWWSHNNRRFFIIKKQEIGCYHICHLMDEIVFVEDKCNRFLYIFSKKILNLQDNNIKYCSWIALPFYDYCFIERTEIMFRLWVYSFGVKFSERAAGRNKLFVKFCKC